MSKTVIVLELVDNKYFNVNGPLDNPEDRKLMIEMFEKAIDVCKNYKGGTLLLANNAIYTELDKTKINQRAKIKI
jgi:hypothetical protein